MSISGSRPSRTLFLVGLSALFFGLIAPITPAVAAEVFSTLPQVSIDVRLPTVGDELSAVLDTAAVPAADAYSYQWYAIDQYFQARAISGATDQKYTATASDVGHKLEVIVKASKAGYSDEEDIADPTGVVNYTFTSNPEVSIDDTTPKVGQMVSAVLEKASVPAAGYDYQWFADDGVHEPMGIGGATGATYIVENGWAGYSLRVRVTAYNTWYYNAYGWSARTAAVEKGDFTADPIPTISDTTPTVGEPLRVNISPSSPAAGSYAPQWRADGVAIAGETNYTFTPTLAQAGQIITVSVTASSYGYNDGAEITSAPTEAVSVPLYSFTRAAIANLNMTTPKVGSVLKVTPTDAWPTPDSYTYQWFRLNTSGVSTAIADATSQTYTVVDADLTRRLSVEATSVKDGYAPTQGPSVWTARVNKITVSKARIAHGHSLTVTARKLRAGQTYRIFIGSKWVYTGRVSSTGTASRVVLVPSATGVRTVRVSGYNKAGARDFTVFTKITVT